MDAASRPAGLYARFGKRAFDLVLVAPGLLLLLPIMALVAVLVRLQMGTPVLFRQMRPGRDEKPFAILKFRTMVDARDAEGRLLSDQERLTWFGRLLRATSLDELPELINVLRGEMSLVGPRPLLTRYLPYYAEEERARFRVLPGITGLAQVSGRNDLCWDERMAADVRYVRTFSLPLDVRILFATFRQVVRRHGLRVDPGAVMLDFDEERRRRAESAGASPRSCDP